MYDKDYIEYENKREVRLRCMKCGEVLKERSDRTLYDANRTPVLVSQYEANSSFHRKTVFARMKDRKTELGVFLCSECVRQDDLDTEALIKQIKRGWELEMQAAQRSETEIKGYFEQMGEIVPWVEA